MAEKDGFAVFSVDPNAIKSLSFPEEAALPSIGLFNLTAGNDGLKKEKESDRPLKWRKT